MMKFLSAILGTRAALVYLALFAAAVGGATFVENDFGTSTAQSVVYQAWWFELLLVLFGGSVLFQMKSFRMMKRKQYATLLFHISILIILLGSGVTRIWGWEGMLHVREGASNATVLSRDTYIGVRVARGEEAYQSEHKVFASSLAGGTHFSKELSSPIGTYSFECVETLVDPKAIISEEGGKGALQVVFGGSNGRLERVLTPESPIQQGNVAMYWSNAKPSFDRPFVVRESSGGLEIASVYAMNRRIMATGAETELPPNVWHPLEFRALHSSNAGQFVFSDYESNGSFAWESGNRKINSSSTVGLKLAIVGSTLNDTILVFGAQGWVGEPVVVRDGENVIEVTFGSTEKTLPFSIALDDFQMTRYPGTDAPATFASEVRVQDPLASEELGYNIHMNHILDYGGYRFFQSSYDQDEMGSYLSVNHDFYGTWITYIGYILLTLGMVLALFSRSTRFAMLRKRASGTLKVAIALLMLNTTLHAQPSQSGEKSTVVASAHAEKVSRIFVQDFRGRIKPMHTLSREVLRKISGKEQIDDLTADQFILSAALYPENWYAVPLIKQGKSPVLFELLGTHEKLVSYDQFFNDQGQYILRDLVREAQGKKPTDKNANDKAVIALDERVNIVNMLFAGQFFKWVPLPGDPNNTWTAATSHGTQKNALASKFFTSYFSALHHAVGEGHYEKADAYVAQLIDYQKETSGALLPTSLQQDLEIALNSFRPFNKLGLLYGALALLFLLLLFSEVFMPDVKLFGRLKAPMYIVAFAPFILHTLALAARWYVSGRAPWSNGYESLIYIGWTSALSGLIFSKKEWGALAATNILSATLMLIAMLSYLNPEITPLVPVLKSYWLTIHVSLEAGSYGFLMLGAIIGMIILSLVIVQTKKNYDWVQKKIDRLHAISELTITGGLYMLSIGTYLGGVWANESWGRYWGWDAKETWALVSILVYAFILHMRFIPKLNSAFAFSVGSFVGLASIVMTYFGVNYYLSGLHSYAAGDPVPIPNWVYVLSISLLTLSIIAYFRKSSLQKE